MKIPLNISKEKSQTFVEHLNSILRSRFSRSEGSSRIGADGSFESFIKGPIKFSTEIPICITLKRSSGGTLEYIEALGEEGALDEATWQASFSELINEVLTSALSDRKERFLQRQLFYYTGPALDGEYWLSGFRFAPLLPEDETPTAFNLERVVCIDMQIDAVDRMQASAIAQQRGSHYAARFSLLLNVGLYRSQMWQRWVLASTDPLKSIRGQLGYYNNEANLTKFPQKGELCALGKYQGNLGDKFRSAENGISLPPESRRIMRTIDRGSIEIKTKFDQVARLFQVAFSLDSQFPSAGFAYRIAALDALSGANGSKKALAAFLSKFAAEPPNEEVIEYMWGKVRSSHFHAGEFPNGEFDLSQMTHPLMDPDTVNRWQINFYCYQLIREVVVKWIYSQLDTSQDDVQE